MNKRNIPAPVKGFDREVEDDIGGLPIKTEEELKKDANILEKRIPYYTRWAWIFVGIGLIVSLIGLLVFIFTDLKLNEFGDFLAGSVASLWALAGLFLIYVAFLGQKQQLIYQQFELRDTKEELRGQKEQLKIQNRQMKKQIFESTFFQLLRLHNEIVDGIDVTEYNPPGMSGSTSRDHEGRDCFKFFYKRLSQTLKEKITKEKFEGRDLDYDTFEDQFRDDFGHFHEEKYERTLDEQLAQIHLNNEKHERLIDQAYQEFYDKHQADVGHYFRNLYHIFKFVKYSNVGDPKFYTDLIRAQLSSDELLLLFYNCLSKYGRTKFKPWIEEYALLHTMPVDQLIDTEHERLYAREAYGDTDSI